MQKAETQPRLQCRQGGPTRQRGSGLDVVSRFLCQLVDAGGAGEVRHRERAQRRGLEGQHPRLPVLPRGQLHEVFGRGGFFDADDVGQRKFHELVWPVGQREHEEGGPLGLGEVVERARERKRRNHQNRSTDQRTQGAGHCLQQGKADATRYFSLSSGLRNPWPFTSQENLAALSHCQEG